MRLKSRPQYQPQQRSPWQWRAFKSAFFLVGIGTKAKLFALTTLYNVVLSMNSVKYEGGNSLDYKDLEVLRLLTQITLQISVLSWQDGLFHAAHPPPLVRLILRYTNPLRPLHDLLRIPEPALWRSVQVYDIHSRHARGRVQVRPPELTFIHTQRLLGYTHHQVANIFSINPPPEDLAAVHFDPLLLICHDDLYIGDHRRAVLFDAELHGAELDSLIETDRYTTFHSKFIVINCSR